MLIVLMHYSQQKIKYKETPLPSYFTNRIKQRKIHLRSVFVDLGNAFAFDLAGIGCSTVGLEFFFIAGS